MGHAVGCLWDEYTSGTEKKYAHWYRNVDNNTDYKWIGLFNRGYNNTLLDNPLGEFQGALRGLSNYRPTENSTMNSGSSAYLSTTKQYGPVNTYHMMASFLIRMGDVRVRYNPDLSCGNNNYGYEWAQYSLDDFTRDWPPNKF